MTQKQKTTVIAIGVQKGGVGKSATSVNLSAALARLGYKILLVDIDPQADSSDNAYPSYEEVLIDEQGEDKTIVPSLFKKEPLQIYKSVIPNVDIAISHIALADPVLEAEQGRTEMRLRRALEPIKSKYDFVLIDCPPSLGKIMLNALVAADQVVIPTIPGRKEFASIPKFLNTIRDLVWDEYAHDLEIKGILLNRYLRNDNLSKWMVGQLRENFDEMLLKTFIPKNVEVGKAETNRTDIFSYNQNSNAAIAFNNLAKELLDL